MTGRWRILPHRIGGEDGRCRDCGRHDLGTAPDTCTRCAVKRYGNAGFFTMIDPVAAFELEGRDQWRNVSQQLRNGQLRSGRFYLFVGHDTGEPLERPPDELLSSEREIAHAQIAHEVGLDLTRRYQQVWVVTTVGCWSVSSL
jgi:hypothetical protein